MKKRHKLLGAAIAASLSFGMYSCGGLITNQTFEFNVGEVVAPVTVSITDAKNGLMPAGLKVFMSGTNSNAVVNSNSLETGFVVQGGTLELGLKPDATPSDETPYSFNIICTAPGYLNGTASVTITADEKSLVAIQMIKLSDLPDGVTAVQGISAAATTAGPREDIRVSTNPTNDIPSSNVVVERETAFKGENGESLSGDVKIDLVHIASNGPGGSSVSTNNVSGVSGLTPGKAVTLLPVSGVVSLEMTVGGNKVYTFAGKKVKLSMEISPSAINSKTKSKFKEGDGIRFFSRDTDTGKWTYEGASTVIRGTDSKLWGVLETAHLSDFAFMDDLPKNACSPAARILVARRAVPMGRYWGEVKNDNASLIYSGYFNINQNTSSVTIGGTSGTRLSLNLYMRKPCPDASNAASLLMGQISGVSACGGTGTMDLSMPAGFLTPETTDFDLWAYCAETPNSKIFPTCAILFRERGGNSCQPFSYLGEMVKGKFTTDRLVVGQAYDFHTIYSGEFTYTVKKTNVSSRVMPQGSGGCK